MLNINFTVCVFWDVQSNTHSQNIIDMYWINAVLHKFKIYTQTKKEMYLLYNSLLVGIWWCGFLVSIEKLESIFKKNIWSSTLECHPLTSVSQGKAQEPLLEDLSTSHFPNFIYIYLYIYKHHNRFTYKNKQTKPKQQ